MSGKIDCLTEFVARSNLLCERSLRIEVKSQPFDFVSFQEGRLSLGKEIMKLLTSNKKEREEWIRNFIKNGG